MSDGLMRGARRSTAAVDSDRCDRSHGEWRLACVHAVQLDASRNARSRACGIDSSRASRHHDAKTRVAADKPAERAGAPLRDRTRASTGQRPLSHRGMSPSVVASFERHQLEVRRACRRNRESAPAFSRCKGKGRSLAGALSETGTRPSGDALGSHMRLHACTESWALIRIGRGHAGRCLDSPARFREGCGQVER